MKYIVTESQYKLITESERYNKPLPQKYMSIRLMVYYRSNQQHGNFDADDLTYDLERILRNKTTMPLIINYDSTNLNKHFDW